MQGSSVQGPVQLSSKGGGGVMLMIGILTGNVLESSNLRMYLLIKVIVVLEF